MKITSLAPLVGAIFLSACASTTAAPRELLEARTTWQRASSGPAARLALVDLHAAQQDLQRAEASFRDEPDSQQTRDYAYVALRRAQTVEARGETLQSEQSRMRAEEDTQRRTGEQLVQTQGALQQSQQNQAMTAQQLTVERQRRVEAERQAQAAMASLRQVAAVREESRGTVITLSGQVLFAPGESTLLPIAAQRLTQVAQALRDQGARHLRVEGFTDSRGSPAGNQRLSQARAEAVRDYLVNQGVPTAQVDAQGYGPDRPIADNRSAEGRANNRRVEIVVAPATGPAVAQQGVPQP
jgi:outer membrane protein OmpA-like peptidoglycan-associated protein